MVYGHEKKCITDKKYYCTQVWLKSSSADIVCHVSEFFLHVHIITHDHLLKYTDPFCPVHPKKLPLHIIHGLHQDQKFIAHDQRFIQEIFVDLLINVLVGLIVEVETEEIALYA